MTPDQDGGPSPQPTAYKHLIKEFCLECGAPLGDGNRFCWSCGAAKDGGKRRAPQTKRKADIVLEYAPSSLPSDLNTINALVGIGCGLLFLVLCPRLIQFLFHKVFGTSFFEPFRNPMTGQIVPYTATIALWSDLAITAFAFVMILDGLLICLSRRPAVIIAALAFTIVTTLGNLLYVIVTWQHGLAWISAVAVVAGMITAGYQRRLLQEKSAG
jgi:hypothetical protein